MDFMKFFITLLSLDFECLSISLVLLRYKPLVHIPFLLFYLLKLLKLSLFSHFIVWCGFSNFFLCSAILFIFPSVLSLFSPYLRLDSVFATLNPGLFELYPVFPPFCLFGDLLCSLTFNSLLYIL